MIELVWVELNDAGCPTRIFRSRKAAHDFGENWVVERNRTEAVASIRKQIFYRSHGYCEICGALVLETSGHMHEQVPRGKGGEISLENSIFICPKCHAREHSDRNPRWGGEHNGSEV